MLTQIEPSVWASRNKFPTLKLVSKIEISRGNFFGIRERRWEQRGKAGRVIIDACCKRDLLLVRNFFW